MKRVGLTGGIGSGKTTVAQIIRDFGYPVYISDAAASRLINEDDSIRSSLVRTFGHSIYSGEGELNKHVFADIIFRDSAALQTVNQLVHPAVMKDFNRWCGQQSAKVVFFESAILFENHLEIYFDFIVCIYASVNTRIQRVVKRDQVPAEKVRERINNQMPDEEKCRRADFIISTETGEDLKMQIDLILKNKLIQ